MNKPSATSPVQTSPIILPKVLSFSCTRGEVRPQAILEGDKDLGKLPKLLEGCTLERQWELDKSAAAFKDATDSPNVALRKAALEGYDRVNYKMDRAIWATRWITPIHWFEEYGVASFKPWFLLLVFLITATILAGFLIRGSMRRRATMLATAAIGDLAPVQLFDAEFHAALMAVVPLLTQEGGRQMSGSGSFTPPGDDLKQLAGSIGSVGGIDISRVVDLMTRAIRYFGYTVQPGVALTNNGLLAYATLRRRSTIVRHWEIHQPFATPLQPSAPVPFVIVSRLAWRLGFIIAGALSW